MGAALSRWDAVVRRDCAVQALFRLMVVEWMVQRRHLRGSSSSKDGPSPVTVALQPLKLTLAALLADLGLVKVRKRQAVAGVQRTPLMSAVWVLACVVAARGEVPELACRHVRTIRRLGRQVRTAPPIASQQDPPARSAIHPSLPPSIDPHHGGGVVLEQGQQQEQQQPVDVQAGALPAPAPRGLRRLLRKHHHPQH